MSASGKSPTLAMYEKIAAVPGGKDLFSRGVCMRAPYFKGIRPRIVELRAGHVSARIRKRRAVQNHIGTVHAIAMCNLCEFVGGLAVEVSRPASVRWIPRGMKVSYLKKAKTDLVGTAELDGVDWSVEQDLPVEVSIRDAAGDEVVHATIDMKISPS